MEIPTDLPYTSLTFTLLVTWGDHKSPVSEIKGSPCARRACCHHQEHVFLVCGPGVGMFSQWIIIATCILVETGVYCKLLDARLRNLFVG